MSKTYLINEKNLVDEWDYENNLDCTPYLITVGSHKKVWWKCKKCGYTWKAEIKSRVNGNGCPACSGAVARIGQNDLATVNPFLSHEWNYEKNKDLLPNMLTSGSSRKVWWKCSKCGHEWQATIYSRTKGSECPICGRKNQIKKRKDTIIKRKGSLYEKNPDLVSEWDTIKNGDITPKMVSCGSNQEVWWKCSKCGHEWQATIYSRVKGTGCPSCGRKKQIEKLKYNVIKNNGSLFEKRPDLVEEWNTIKNGDITPKMVSCGSNQKVWWKCSKCGYEWQTTVKNRSNGNNCPACYKRNRTSFPEQAIYYYVKMQYPDAINGYTDIFENSMELDIYIPSLNIGIEYDGYHWHNDSTYATEEKKYAICKKHEIKLIRVKETKDNVNKKDNCDILLSIPIELTDDMINKTINQLKKYILINSEISVEKDRFKILQQYYDNVYENSISARTPQLIEEWHPVKNYNITPDMFNYGSNQKVWWKCSKCGYEWQAIVVNRVKGSGCPHCARIKFEQAKINASIINKGSIKENSSILLKEWIYEKNLPLTSDKVSIGSNKKIWWKCSKCGYEWQAIVVNRAKGSGCPQCGKKRQIESYKKTKLLKNGSLLEKRPELVIEWNQIKNEGITPDNVNYCSKQKVWWKCKKCGYEWQATIYNRNRGSSCPRCKKELIRKNRIEQIILKKGSLKDNCPLLVEEWMYKENLPITPESITAGSNQKVWWKCKKCGYEWQATIYNRAKGSNCPKCN